MKIQVRINEEGALRNQRHAFSNRFTLVSELLQNARRAGARLRWGTPVAVSLRRVPLCIAVPRTAQAIRHAGAFASGRAFEARAAARCRAHPLERRTDRAFASRARPVLADVPPIGR